MIETTIDNKTVLIPSFRELTVKQYKQCFENLKGGNIDIVTYLAIVFDTDYEKAQKFEVNNITMLNNLMGKFHYIRGNLTDIEGTNFIEDIKPHLIFKHKEYIHDFRQFKIGTAGHRVLIEQELNNKASFIDLYTFTLAMVVQEKYDYDEIKEIQKELEERNHIEILSLGSFFFFNIMIGGKKDSLLSKMLKKVLSTKTKVLKHKPELTA